MISTQFAGPYLLRATMNNERYLKMLKKNFVWPTISEWENARELLFKQDGAPPHFASTVRAWLDNQFSRWWLGCQGPTEWPA